MSTLKLTAKRPAPYAMAAGFRKFYKTYNVVVDIGMRVFEAVTYPGLCSKVTHLIEPFAFKELFQVFVVFEVHANKAVTGVFCALHHGMPFFGFPPNSGFSQPGILQVYIVVVVNVVDANYFVAPLEEAFGEVEADKAGGSCD